MQVLGAQAPKVLISQDWRARVCESLVPREHVEKSSFNILSKGRAGLFSAQIKARGARPPQLVEWGSVASPGQTPEAQLQGMERSLPSSLVQFGH